MNISAIQTIHWERYGIAGECGSEWSMDARHAEWIKAALVSLQLDTAVEVGCLFGVSTLAILEAGVPDVHLIDVRITDSVRQMATDYGAKLYEETSEAAMPTVPTSTNMAVLIDGDHSLAVLQKEYTLLARLAPRVVIAHDVTAQHVGLGCEGCSWLWHEMQQAGWYCYVDSLPRTGERTSRGVMIATRTPEDHAAVVASWREVNA